MKKVVQKMIVAVVVLHENKILIIQRSEGDEDFPCLWEIPSGKREPFEKTVDGVKREVMEETGLNVEVGDPIGVFDFKVEKEDEIRDVTQISFLVTPIGGVEVKLSHEHQKFAWITEKEIDNYNISKETKEIIKKAFKS